MGDEATLDKSPSQTVREQRPDLRDVMEEAAAESGGCLAVWVSEQISCRTAPAKSGVSKLAHSALTSDPGHFLSPAHLTPLQEPSSAT